MTLNIFVALLTVLIACNILITQAIKNTLNNSNKKYSSNLIALVSAIVAGGGGSVIAYIFLDVAFTVNSVACIVLFVLAVWVGSMIGFDKIFQLIEQIKNLKIQ